MVATSLSVFAQQPSGQGCQVPLQVSIINPDDVLGSGPKAPIRPPYVTYQDYTLFIWGEHAGYTVTLLDDNDTVVYQTYVYAGTQMVSLPTTLSGSYTLQLSDDTFVFTGIIDL